MRKQKTKLEPDEEFCLNQYRGNVATLDNIPQCEEIFADAQSINGTPRQ
jgi:hypothetical protein